MRRRLCTALLPPFACHLHVRFFSSAVYIFFALVGSDLAGLFLYCDFLQSLTVTCIRLENFCSLLRLLWDPLES